MQKVLDDRLLTSDTKRLQAAPSGTRYERQDTQHRLQSRTAKTSTSKAARKKGEIKPAKTPKFNSQPDPHEVASVR
jgi:hypothetical protein